MKFTAFIEEMKQMGIHIRQDIEMKYYTSLHIGGQSALFYEPSNILEIMQIIKSAKKYRIPYCVLGNGSNVLIHDEGYPGLSLVLSTLFHRMEVQGTQLYAQAGAKLKDVCELAYQHHLGGIEFAYGIPASVGGATYMNAGAYGGEIKDVFLSCTYLDEQGEICLANREDMQFAYRHSLFADRQVVVLSTTFALQSCDEAMIRDRMDELMRKRIEKQPLEYPSAGSTFKRPVGSFASKLIAESNLKGYAIGDAQVSNKHAGFLINKGHASSEQFLQLIAHVKQVVYEESGYELECEIRIL